MNTINRQLDKELFGEYPVLLLRPHLHPHPHPHLILRPLLRLHPRLHLHLRHLLRPHLSYEVINQIDNSLYIGWDYGDSVLELL